MSKLVIAISREYASGGRLVGEKLADDLGIAFYDRKLIELAAQESGLSPDFIEKSEERASSSFLFTLATNAHASNSYFMHYDIPANDKAFFAQSSVIRELAQKENCVIVGRCGGYILRDHPGCLNVFLYGDLNDRLSRAVEQYGMDKKGLANKLVKADKGRANYHKYYTGEDWYNIKSYDMAVNTTVSGIDGAVESIKALVPGFKKRKYQYS